MEFWFWIVAACLSSIWVYWDATANKIGKIETEGGVFNMSAGAWAAVTLGIFVIGFPAYLINRRRLIEKAKEQPRESIFKKGGAVILAICMAGLLYLTAPGGLFGAVPSCDSGEVIALTERLITDNPAIRQIVNQQGAAGATIADHAEVSYEAETEVRRCSAIIRIASLEERAFYEVSWHDRTNSEFRVEFTN